MSAEGSNGHLVDCFEGSIRLSDGRRLAFVEVGEPGGRPILWFHGLPGGRWQIPPDAPGAARRHGMRIFCVSRPGIGRSSRHHGASLLSFAHDVIELADDLGLDRFAVAALSAGAPYALACAHHAPDRVAVGALLGGIVPLADRERLSIGERLLTLLLRGVRPGHPYLAAGLDLYAPILGPLVPSLFSLYCRVGPRADRPVLNQPGMHEMFGDDFARSVRAGIAGFFYDAAVLGAPWGFSPSDVTVPIRVWHGDIDPLVPLADAERLARTVANGKLHVVPGHGHYAGLVRAPEVIADLAASWPA